MPSSSDGVVTATLLAASASVELVVDFTVAGSPISGTAASTVYAVTVTEQTNGYVVRGLSSAAAPGGAAVGLDGEAPFDSSLSYVARAYGATGALLATSAACATTVSSSGVTTTWIKSLSTPSMSQQVRVQTIPAWDADIAQGVIPVINRADPIVVQDVRQYETGTLEVRTLSAAAEAALKALLATPGPYLLQQPGFGTADRFVTVGKVTRKREENNAAELFRVWSLPLTQVVRPAVAGWSVAIPGKTYADTSAARPLYSNRTGTYLSRSQ